MGRMVPPVRALREAQGATLIDRHTLTGGSGQPTNHRAARELRRVQMVLTREGQRLCGDGYERVGDLDRIIHRR